MPSVYRMEWMHNPALPGVAICRLSDHVRVGSPQRVLVRVEPQGQIPLHTHSVDAKMTILAGDGWIVSRDATDGRAVSPGVCVFYERDAPHGFRAGDAGLTFMSENGGIVDDDPESWDMEFRQ
jgi:quercetin dioxygenase-like cupin family protein